MAAGKYKRIPNKGYLCSAPDCTNPSYCRGICREHYNAGRLRQLCSEPGCGKPMLARGLCQAHYCRWKNHGTTSLLQRTPKQCSVDGCEKKATRKGLCGNHYNQKRYIPSTRTKTRRLFVGPPKPRYLRRSGPMCAEPGCFALTSGPKRKYCKDHKYRV